MSAKSPHDGCNRCVNFASKITISQNGILVHNIRANLFSKKYAII